MSKLVREFFLIWLIGFCVIGGFLLIAFPVKAHDAPSGMEYDAACCNGTAVTGDCAPIPDSAVRITADGYHACLYPTEDRLLCLYVPPIGSQQNIETKTKLAYK